jgi:hypothetical protein
MYVYCVYPAMSKKSENLSDLNKKDRNKRHSSPFINAVKGVRNRHEKLAEGSLFCLFLKLVQIHFIFTDNVRILYPNIQIDIHFLWYLFRLPNIQINIHSLWYLFRLPNIQINIRFLVGSCYSIFSFLCIVCPCVLLFLAIVLSVLLQFTSSYYPFGILAIVLSVLLQFMSSYYPFGILAIVLSVLLQFMSSYYPFGILAIVR